MVDQVEQRVSEWVHKNLHGVDVAHPASDHLNIILGRDLEMDTMIDLSLVAFQILIEEIESYHNPVQPMLFIRLISERKRLQAKTPKNLSEIKDEWRSIEPPELYLLDWDTRKFLSIYEEYRCPLQFDLFRLEDDSIYAFYSESRSMIDLENRWEYGRSIQVYYFPEEYRL